MKQGVGELYDTIEECLHQQLDEIPNTKEARFAMAHALAHILAVVIDNGETSQERFFLLSFAMRFFFQDLPIGNEHKDRPSNTTED